MKKLTMFFFIELCTVGVGELGRTDENILKMIVKN